MRKTIFLLCCLLLTAMSTTAKSYKIQGRLHGNVEGKTVYLCKMGDTDETKFRPAILDSAIVKDGLFVFKGKISEPTLLLIKYFPNDNRGDMEGERAAMRPCLPLFIDGGKIKVEASVDSMQSDFETAIYNTYDYKDAVISGSPLNDLYREYKQGYTDRTNQISEMSMAFNRKYYNEKSIMPMTQVVEELNRQNNARKEQCDYLTSFITRNSGNAAGVMALNETLGRFDKAGIEKLINTLSPEMKATVLGQQTIEKANIIKATATGAQFADVTLVDANRKEHQLSEYLGKGNYTLLEFWASWCGPCRGSIPHLKQVYGLYHQQGFDIVSVSMDTDNKAWHKALDEEKMKWTQLICKDGFGEVAKTYNFNGIPYCVLIGPKGEIVETNCRDARLDRQLVNIYGNKLETLHLQAEIDELKDSIAILSVPYGSAAYNIKKYPLKNGKLDIQLPLTQPMQMSIRIPGDYMGGISFPGVAGEEICIKGSKNDPQISGSNFYQEYAELNKQINPYIQKTKTLRENIEQLWADLGLRNNTVKGKQKEKNQKIYDEAKKKYIEESDAALNEIRQKTKDFILTHPRSDVSVAALGSVAAKEVDDLTKKLNYFVANGRMKPVIDALKKQAENEKLAEEARNSVKEGAMAPDFTLDDINGKPFTLSSMRGKWVVLDFWGSWCGWCIKGMPDMKKYYEKYRGKFEIIGIDCNDTVEKWKKAVKDNELPWLHVYNKAADGTPEKYAVEGYPTKIIINPDGTINKIIVGESQDFYNYLDELLN